MSPREDEKVNGLANMTTLLAIGLIVGALAGTAVLGSSGVVATRGAAFEPAAFGSNSGNHGSCVSSAVHRLLGMVDHGSGLGELVRSMARRC